MPLAYRPEIDGLRAVAVSLVIFSHYRLFAALKGGFVGVDVFFVISGYLITRIILGDLDRGRFQPLAFYLNRMRRILPALLVVLGVAFVGACFVLLPYELTIFGRELVSAALFLSNVYYTKLGGYFDAPQQDHVLLHSWSLGVEEQFYALWPWVLVGLHRLRGGRHLRVAILLGAVVSLAIAQAALPLHPRFAFYEIPARVWEFALGALASSLPRASRRPLPASARGGLAFGGLALVAWVAFAYDDATPFPGLAAVAPCLGAACFILFSPGTPVGSLMALRPLVAIGRISYSLYLWHWPVLVLTRLTLGREPGIDQRLLLLLLVVALSWLSWRFVETPFRRRTRGPRPRWIAVGAGGVAACVAVGLALHLAGGFPGRLGPEPAWLARADRDAAVFQESGCLARGADLPPVAGCLLGKADGSDAYSVVLWGDSHAAQWAPAIDRIGRDLGFTAREITKAGCGPFPGLHILPTSDMVRECGAFGTRVLSTLEQSHGVRVVILAARWEPFVRGAFRLTQPGTPETEAASLALLTTSLRTTIADLTSRGMAVIVLGQTPVPPANAFACIKRALLFRGDAQHCYTEAGPGYAAEESRAQALLQAALPPSGAATLVPLFPLFCSDAGCRFGDAGRTDFMDETHLSPDAAIEHDQPIRDALARALGSRPPP